MPSLDRFSLKGRTILFACLLIGSISVITPSQILVQPTPRPQSSVKQEELLQGLFNTDRSKVDCVLIEDNVRDDLLNSKTPILIQELRSVYHLDSVDPAITYDFVRGDKTAYAVSIGVCDKQYRGKGKKLILVGENIVTSNQTGLEKQLTLVAVLAHEMAHFKQQALHMKLVDKEVELHADFMAGWYLAQYVAKLNLERGQKLRSVMTALSMFYYFGQDEKPSVLYGTPENRLQISLDGYQEKASDADAVYLKGINVIKQNPIYWNLPDEVGTRIKESLSSVSGQEESIDIFGLHCPGRILTGDNKSLERVFSCRVSAPNKLGTDQIYQTDEQLYDALNKGFLSYLPPNTIKTPGSENTDFNIHDSSYPITYVGITNLKSEIVFGITFGIPFNKFPTKTEISSRTPEAETLENQIFELAKKPRTLDIQSIALLGGNCLVSAKLDGTRVVVCDDAQLDFEKRKEILYSLIPKGFHVLRSTYSLVAWNPDENEVKDRQYYSKRQSLHSPINFISLTKPDDRVPHIAGSSEGKLVMSVNSGATIGTIVTEKRILNSIGQEYDQKVTSMSKSEKQLPSFTFWNTPCDVDEVDKYSWVVECQMKPDRQRNETIDSVFTTIRNGIASWSPTGWEEDESEEFYNLRQPEQFTELPTATEIGVRKTKAFVQLHFYVNEKNSKVKFGTNNPNPNRLGQELLSQISNLTNLDINTAPSFQLFGQKCRVEYVKEQFGNHVSCTFLGSKEANRRVFNQLEEAVNSILPKNWKYRTEENSVDAERIYGFKCPSTPQNQNIMCLPITIYFSIKENGTIYFNIDFDNDDTKLNKL